MNRHFYVYLHRKRSTGEVFYVGKGSGRRAWVSNGRNSLWLNIAAKHGVVIEVVVSGVQEWYALELEQTLIAYYGKEALANMCEGGTGTAGYKHNLRNKKICGNSWRGKSRGPQDQTRRLAASAARGGAPIVCVETGTEFVSTYEAASWLVSLGVQKAAGQNILKAVKGDLKSAYGFKWIRKNI